MKLIPLLIIIPVCEIFLFITIGNYIGLFYVLFLTLLTAFIGLSLVKAHWKKNLKKYRVNSSSNSWNWRPLREIGRASCRERV